MIAAWQVLHDRLPVGVGHVGDQHVAGAELGHLLHAAQHADRASADALADGPPRDQDVAAALQLEAAQRAVVRPRHHGLRPGLQHVELAVDAVLGPLDVHGPSVVLLDDQGVARELLHLLVGEGEQHALVGGDVLEGGAGPRRAAVGVAHGDRLLAHRAAEDGGAPGAQRPLGHVELVGVHRPLHHGLAQPVGAGHEDHLVEAGLGVDGEEHPGGAHVGAHHALHAGRQRDVVVEPVVGAVGDGAVVVERGVHAADRRQHVVHATHVEEGLLLPGEGGVGQVLRRRRGAHGPRHGVGVGLALQQRGVRAPDRGLQVRWEGLRLHPAPHLRPDPRQRGDVLDVHLAHGRDDARVEAVVRQEAPVGVGGGGEPARHPHAEGGEVADHLPERGVLAAHTGQVGHGDLLEPQDVGHDGSSPDGRSRRCSRDWRITADISSTLLVEELTKGMRLRWYSCSARRSSSTHWARLE